MRSGARVFVLPRAPSASRVESKRMSPESTGKSKWRDALKRNTSPKFWKKVVS